MKKQLGNTTLFNTKQTKNRNRLVVELTTERLKNIYEKVIVDLFDNDLIDRGMFITAPTEDVYKQSINRIITALDGDPRNYNNYKAVMDWIDRSVEESVKDDLTKSVLSSIMTGKRSGIAGITSK